MRLIRRSNVRAKELILLIEMVQLLDAAACWMILEINASGCCTIWDMEIYLPREEYKANLAEFNVSTFVFIFFLLRGIKVSWF